MPNTVIHSDHGMEGLSRSLANPARTLSKSFLVYIMKSFFFLAKETLSNCPFSESLITLIFVKLSQQTACWAIQLPILQNSFDRRSV